MSYWDTQANRWGVFSVPDEDYDKYTARQADFIVEQLDLGDEAERVIDMGCGIGRLTYPIAEALPCVHVWGLDPSSAMIQKAKDDSRFGFFSPSLLCDLFLADSVDGAWSVLVFQHLLEAPIRTILHDLADVLKPGARFVSQWMLDVDQPFPLRADVLRVLEEEGFQTVRYQDDTDVTKLWFADNWLWVTSERTP